MLNTEMNACIKRNIISLDLKLSYIPGHILEVLNAGLEGAVAGDLLMRILSQRGGRKGQEERYLN